MEEIGLEFCAKCAKSEGVDYRNLSASWQMTEYLEQLCSRNVMVIPYSHICNAAGESLSFSLLNGA